MIHVVEKQTGKILDYIQLGEFWDDNHRKSLKDTLETYEFRTFGNKRYSEHLAEMNRIIIPDEDDTFTELIIDNVWKYRSGNMLIVEVFSSASYLLLKKAKVIKPQRTPEYTVSQHLGFALNGTEWTPGIVESDKYRTIEIENSTNPYAYIKKIANEFDLEIRFRVEADGTKVVARYVDLLERVGQWQGREVEFGRDLLGIERKEDFSNIVTALIGLGPEREDGARLEVLVEDDEALQRWGTPNPQTGKLMHLIETYEPKSTDQNMTTERLTELTRNELEKRVNSVVEYVANVADLEKVPGMERKKIRFGDTIKIKDTGFSPPLYLEARVHTQDRSLSRPSQKTVTLGEYIEYTEEEVQAVWRALQAQIRERLERLVTVSVSASAGTVFKNGEGSTSLTAKTFVVGGEVDEDGTKYEYRWHKFDKNGDYDAGFYEEGKTINVNASTVDEKATFRVEIILNDEVLTLGEITLTNVFDGEDGEQGPPGPKGDKGDKGDPGPQGPPGTSVESIVEYYLATDQSSGVTTDTPGWTTTMQQMTPQKRYLWNYERINFSDGTHQNTNPVIIGVYGDEGEEGRSVVDITEYYLASSASSGVTRSTSGWTTTMQVTTPEKKYLWNYEKITWNKAPTTTYTDPVIIGVHGEQGPKGEDGKTFYTWIKYADTPTSGMSDSQEGKEYIGIAYNKETPTPSTNYADYVWSKFKGEQGVPGPPGEDGQPTYTWVKYADDEYGNGMSDSPDGKLYIGLAFNKTTPEESNNPADYTWSLMPQNIEVGGRNLAPVTGMQIVTYYLDDASNRGEQVDERTFKIYANPPNGTSFLFGYAEVVHGKEYILNADMSDTISSFAGVVVYDENKNILEEDGLLSGDLMWVSTYRSYLQLSEEIVKTPLKFKVEDSRVKYVRLRLGVYRGNVTDRDVLIRDQELREGNKTLGWSPAPEDVQAEIDEAKQEAEEAKQEAQQAQTTADGKNTVFRQSSQPPTSGRKIGDVWFDTSRDNLMHVFNGTQWVEAKWGEQSIVANSITANHIKSLVGLNVNDQFVVDSNGNVKFAGHLEGATGSFISEGSYDGANHKVDINRIITLENPYYKAEIAPSSIKQIDKINDVVYYYWEGGMRVNHTNGQPIAGMQVQPSGYLSIYAHEGYNWLNIDVEETTIAGNVYISSFDTPLWTGQAYPLDTQTITPSKLLSDCMTGWILRFQRYVVGTGIQDNNFHYIHIPKIHSSLKNGAGIRITLGEDTDQTVTKYIYVYNDRIVGHASNNKNRSQNRALTGVFEY